MPRTQDQHESEGPGYRDRLPLRWLPLPELPAGLEAERLAETNARLLAAVAMLEEHPNKPKPADEPSATDLELQRIHLKLNLLLELFSGFLLAQSPQPPAVPLRLSWRGVSWETAEAPAPGATGLVEIHLSRLLVQPLRWPARIVAGPAGTAVAEFCPLSDFCQEALERHVFQHHRREVAEARQPARHAS